MIKKIIALSVSFACCFVAIFFSVRQTQFTGKGEGVDAELKNPTELSELISKLPTSSEYYNNYSQGAQAQKSGVEDDKNFRSVTLEDSSYNNLYIWSTTKDENKEVTNTSEFILDREMTVNFTETAVHYDVVGRIYQGQSVSTSYRNNHNYVNGQLVTSERTVEISYYDLDYQLYIGDKGVFIKFNKWDLIQESAYYLNGNLMQNKIKNNQSKLAQKSLDILRSNYGVWISLNNAAVDNESMEVVKLGCAMIAESWAQVFLDVNDRNVKVLNDIGESISGAEKSENEDFNVSVGNTIYKMTSEAKVDFLKYLGWIPKSTEYLEREQCVKDGIFIVSLLDKANPKINVDFAFTNENGNINKDGLNVGQRYTIREDMIFSHIDNTVTPNIKSSKNMYNMYGGLIDEIVNEDN